MRAHGCTVIETVLALLMLAVLTQVAIAGYTDYRERAAIARAATDIAALENLIARYAAEHRVVPRSLADIGRADMKDPWGNPYQYFDHSGSKGNGQLRRGKRAVPINSDFDLYSMGKDGRSAASLSAEASRDDIIRGDDGRIVALATQYDP